LQRRRRAPAPRRRKHPVVAAAAAARQGRHAPTPRALRPPTSPYARGEARLAEPAPPSSQRESDDGKTSPRRRHRARRRRRGQTKTRVARRRQVCHKFLQRPLLRRRCTVALVLRRCRRRSATTSPAAHAAGDTDQAYARDRVGCRSPISRWDCPAHSRGEDEGYVGDRRHPPRLGPRRRRLGLAATAATATPGGGGTAGLPCPCTHARHEDGLAADAGAGHRCRLFATLYGPGSPALPCTVVDAQRIPPFRFRCSFH